MSGPQTPCHSTSTHYLLLSHSQKKDNMSKSQILEVSQILSCSETLPIVHLYCADFFHLSRNQRKLSNGVRFLSIHTELSITAISQITHLTHLHIYIHFLRKDSISSLLQGATSIFSRWPFSGKLKILWGNGAQGWKVNRRAVLA